MVAFSSIKCLLLTFIGVDKMRNEVFNVSVNWSYKECRIFYTIFFRQVYYITAPLFRLHFHFLYKNSYVCFICNLAADLLQLNKCMHFVIATTFKYCTDLTMKHMYTFLELVLVLELINTIYTKTLIWHHYFLLLHLTDRTSILPS